MYTCQLHQPVTSYKDKEVVFSYYHLCHVYTKLHMPDKQRATDLVISFPSSLIFFFNFLMTNHNTVLPIEYITMSAIKGTALLPVLWLRVVVLRDILS